MATTTTTQAGTTGATGGAETTAAAPETTAAGPETTGAGTDATTGGAETTTEAGGDASGQVTLEDRCAEYGDVSVPDGFNVGLVTDIGRVDDGTFNQFAYEGMVAAEECFGIATNFIETQSEADYEATSTRSWATSPRSWSRSAS